MILTLIICMIFCHIVDDYYLQGWLASAKQKSWWEKNCPDEFYKNDWVMALAMHSMSWSFMIMLPILIECSFNPPIWYFVFWVINAIIHFNVDNFKANLKIINLITDQLIHIFQIIITACIYMLLK